MSTCDGFTPSPAARYHGLTVCLYLVKEAAIRDHANTISAT